MEELSKKIKKLSEERDELIAQKREEQEPNRLRTLKELFKLFREVEYQDEAQNIELSDELLLVAIQSYYDDIYRFKTYSHSEFANTSKKSAFMIKWLSKIKPIQIKPNAEFTKKLCYVNSSFALYVGFAMINVKIEDFITPDFYKELMYNTYFRDVCPKQLSAVMHILLQNSKNELP